MLKKIIMKKSKYSRLVRLILVLILFSLGIMIRFYKLGKIPPGLNQDEAAIGYDSYAHLNFKIDRNGYHNPIIFISYGPGQYSLSIYLSMFFIKLFGLNPFSVRFTNFFFGIISIMIFYLLTKKIFNKDFAILALFLIVINPWHFMMTRWGLDGNLFPLVFIIGFYLLILSIKKHYCFLPACFIFGICLYSYGTTYFFIPVFFFLIVSYLIINKTLSFPYLIAGICLFFIIAFPIIIYLIINHFDLPTIRLSWISIPKLTGLSRMSGVTSLSSNNIVTSSFNNFLDFCKMYFITQNDHLIWNSPGFFGQFFYINFPFLLFGIFIFYKRYFRIKKIQKGMFILIWFSVALLMSFITKPNINRMNIIYFPTIIFITIGIFKIQKFGKGFFVLIILVNFLLFGTFCYYYFNKFPNYIGEDFNESLDDALDFCNDNNYRKLILTNSIKMPYIYVLFNYKIQPEIFMNSVVYQENKETFRKVKSFADYKFGFRSYEIEKSNIYLVRNFETDIFLEKGFSIKTFKYFSVCYDK